MGERGGGWGARGLAACVLGGWVWAALACAPPREVAEDCASTEDGVQSVLQPQEGEVTRGLVVSLHFDDGYEVHAEIATLLAQYGMRGTFFVNGGRLGSPGHLALEQVHAIEAAGHEIGGHTLTHERLSSLDAAEQRRQICDDRAMLLAAGLRITSFSFPFGDDPADARRLVAECGYEAARDSGGLQGAGGCSSCPRTESLPPRDVLRIRSTRSMLQGLTLEDLQQQVLMAEEEGGLLPLVFHNVCDPCAPEDAYGVRRSLLVAFLEWLQSRAERGTVVRPLARALATEPEPPGDVTSLPTRPPLKATQLLRDGSLEGDPDGDGIPDCWSLSAPQVGTTWSRSRESRSGAWAQRLDVRCPATGGGSLRTRWDDGACSPRVRTGDLLQAAAWYRGQGAPHLQAHVRDAEGTWRLWTRSPDLPTGTRYRQGRWRLPPVPAGTTQVSIGLSLEAQGSLVMDDFTLELIEAAAP